MRKTHKLVLYQRDRFRRLVGSVGLRQRLTVLLNTQVVMGQLAGTDDVAAGEPCEGKGEEVVGAGAGAGATQWRVIHILHKDETPACELAAQLADADIFVTPHGFQSMLLLLLPPQALVFELYPHLYFKPGYQPLAQSMGLRHAYSTSPPNNAWVRGLARLMTTETCMAWKLCRRFVRKSDVELTDAALKQLVHEARCGKWTV